METNVKEPCQHAFWYHHLKNSKTNETKFRRVCSKCKHSESKKMRLDWQEELWELIDIASTIELKLGKELKTMDKNNIDDINYNYLQQLEEENEQLKNACDKWTAKVEESEKEVVILKEIIRCHCDGYCNKHIELNIWKETK